MKPSEIKARHIYANRGKGTTLRFVLAMGPEHVPSMFFSSGPRPDEDGVYYRDNRGNTYCLYLSSFAKWAGKCVGREDGGDWTITDDIDHSLLENLE